MTTVRRRYMRWQGIRAAHVPLAKRDGIAAAGPGWIEVQDGFTTYATGTVLCSCGASRDEAAVLCSNPTCNIIWYRRIQAVSITESDPRP